MTAISQLTPCTPTRCFILCSKSKFDQDSEDVYGTALIREVVHYFSGDYEKAYLLGSITGKNTCIVFDYENPDHLDTCDVLGFRVGKSIRKIPVPGEVIHSRVRGWKEANKCHNLSFPYLGQIKSSTTKDPTPGSLDVPTADYIEMTQFNGSETP